MEIYDVTFFHQSLADFKTWEKKQNTDTKLSHVKTYCLAEDSVFMQDAGTHNKSAFSAFKELHTAPLSIYTEITDCSTSCS